MADKLVDIDLEKRHETDSAFLLTDGSEGKDGKEIRFWVPKSQCQDNEDGTFTMPEWLAIEKGIV